MVTSGAITYRLAKLEHKGLVERLPGKKDRRAVRVRLTEAGRELIDRVVVDHVANEERMLSGLTAAEREALNAALRTPLWSLGDHHLG